MAGSPLVHKVIKSTFSFQNRELSQTFHSYSLFKTSMKFKISTNFFCWIFVHFAPTHHATKLKSVPYAHKPFYSLSWISQYTNTRTGISGDILINFINIHANSNEFNSQTPVFWTKHPVISVLNGPHRQRTCSYFFSKWRILVMQK